MLRVRDDSEIVLSSTPHLFFFVYFVYIFVYPTTPETTLLLIGSS